MVHYVCNEDVTKIQLWAIGIGTLVIVCPGYLPRTCGVTAFSGQISICSMVIVAGRSNIYKVLKNLIDIF